MPEQRPIQQKTDDLLNGVARAVCYSGFRTGQHPDRGDGAVNPTDAQILEDLKIISTDSQFNLIRLYDCGENSEAVLRIIKTNKLNIKVMLGIWLKAELSNHETCVWLTEPIPQEELDQNYLLNQQEIDRGIRLANQYPEQVIAVNVGNEALVDWNDHKVDTDSIIAYVQRVKGAIDQPVTVADNYEWWAANGQKLARELDFVAIHVYPVWEGKDINEAMSYTIENVQKVRDALPDSRLVITEAGWASIASEFGERASEEKQLKYYNDLYAWAIEMNITTFFFEAFDEDWKGDPANPNGAEKHWGLFTVDRKPKKVMQ
ncbi:glycosyl hydrolase family 17 protein [Mangrovibacterium sp.]|uniref:glycosyl hydrolase family 17 protein n=1 Tax=Mangrovibacterium sp. TaxID=1961364 RepID=UPI003563DD09